MSEKRFSPDKETAAFDVEGTLTTGAAWEGLRDYLHAQGQGDLYRAFQRRMLPRYLLYRLNMGNKQAFKEDWVAGVLALAAGRTRASLVALGRHIVTDYLWPLRREDVLSELRQHQADGRQILLVSGQFQPFLDAFVAQVGADAGIGTEGIWQDSRFSGQLALPFTTGERKAELLKQTLNDGALVAAYGDTGPDVPMLALSERPTAVYPDDALRRAAKTRGWRTLG